MHTIEVTSHPCLVCGRGNTPDGVTGERPLFVDLERDVNWNDPAVLCEDCAIKVGSIVGLLGPDERDALSRDIRNRDKEIHRLNAELASMLPSTMPLNRLFDAPDVADVGTDAQDHPPVARSTPLIAFNPRKPTITFDRCPISRTSASTSTSIKSC